MANIKKKTKHRNLRKRGCIYHFRIQWQGQTLKRSLGTTKEAIAVDLRDKYLENLRLYGQLDVPEEEKNQEDMTFLEVVKMWVPIHKDEVKYSTWRDYRSAMNCYLLPAFKDRPIKDISYMEIKKFRKNLKVSRKRANNIMVPMKSVFEMAHIEGFIKDNVMKKIKRAKEEKPDIHPFSEKEIKQILSSIDSWYCYYTMLAFYTGLRGGELNGLRWIDYKPKMPNGPELSVRNNYVYGKDGKPKTKSSIRKVECLPEAEYALLKQKALTGGSEYIFLTKDGNRMTPDHFREIAWKPALTKAEIEYRPPIQTRHTFATMMLSRGEEIGWVKNMMGHSSLQMIYQRYYSWIPKKSKAGKDGLNDEEIKRLESMFVEQDNQEQENEGEEKDVEAQAGEQYFSGSKDNKIGSGTKVVPNNEGWEP